MFVLSAIAVFSCVKMMGSFFTTPENMSASWVDGVAHTPSGISFKKSSEKYFLRSYEQARGSHSW